MTWPNLIRRNRHEGTGSLLSRGVGTINNRRVFATCACGGEKTYKTGLNGSTKTFYLTTLVGGERWRYDRKDVWKRRSGPDPAHTSRIQKSTNGVYFDCWKHRGSVWAGFGFLIEFVFFTPPTGNAAIVRFRVVENTKKRPSGKFVQGHLVNRHGATCCWRIAESRKSSANPPGNSLIDVISYRTQDDRPEQLFIVLNRPKLIPIGRTGTEDVAVR